MDKFEAGELRSTGVLTKVKEKPKSAVAKQAAEVVSSAATATPYASVEAQLQSTLAELHRRQHADDSQD